MEFIKFNSVLGLIKLLLFYFGGGIIWTFLLAGLFRFCSRFLNYKHIKFIDRISGLFIFALGLVAIIFVLSQLY